MTKTDRIKQIYKELSPIFNSYSNLGLLPLNFRDIQEVSNRNRMELEWFYYKGHKKQMELKKNKVSPSLFLAANINKELGDVLYADKVRLVLEDLIKSNPKKYYRKK